MAGEKHRGIPRPAAATKAFRERALTTPAGVELAFPNNVGLCVTDVEILPGDSTFVEELPRGRWAGGRGWEGERPLASAGLFEHEINRDS